MIPSYTQAQRAAHAEQHILAMAALNELHLTSCWHICRTYGVMHMLDALKELRAKFRTELSFSEQS
jgi:hypothetical protein